MITENKEKEYFVLHKCFACHQWTYHIHIDDTTRYCPLCRHYNYLFLIVNKPKKEKADDKFIQVY